jgi:hypothetical protein
MPLETPITSKAFAETSQVTTEHKPAAQQNDQPPDGHSTGKKNECEEAVSEETKKEHETQTPLQMQGTSSASTDANCSEDTNPGTHDQQQGSGPVEVESEREETVTEETETGHENRMSLEVPHTSHASAETSQVTTETSQVTTKGGQWSRNKRKGHGFKHQ